MALVLTSGRTLFALIVQKLITLWLGPVGLGQLGQFHSLWQVFQSLAAGGGRDGLTKLSAEKREQSVIRANQSLYAFVIFTSAAGVLLGLLLFFSAPMLIRWMDFPEMWRPVLHISAVLVLFSGPWFCLQSYFMGVGKWYLLVLIQGIASVTPVLILLILRFLPVDLKLFSPLAFSLPPLIAVLGLSVFQLPRARFITVSFFYNLKDTLRTFWPNYKRLTLLVLPALFCGPLSLIIVRHFLSVRLGWEITGQYQALLRFFELPVTLFVTFLSIYYVPELGRLKSKNNGNWGGFTRRVFLLLILFTLLLSALILKRKQIFTLLFSDEIVISSLWFSGFVIITFLRLWTWILGLQLLAFESWKPYWVIELTGSAIWVGLSLVVLPRFGVTGIIGAQIFESVISICMCYMALAGIRKKALDSET